MLRDDITVCVLDIMPDTDASFPDASKRLRRSGSSAASLASLSRTSNAGGSGAMRRSSSWLCFRPSKRAPPAWA